MILTAEEGHAEYKLEERDENLDIESVIQPVSSSGTS